MEARGLWLTSNKEAYRTVCLCLSTYHNFPVP